MAAQPEPVPRAGRSEDSSADTALAGEVESWVVHLGRTLKTCRLYDAGNPTVVRFREDLARSLQELLGRCDPLTLEVASKSLLLGGAPVYIARSRDDNLAAVFHRDGIRQIVFHAGLDARELDFLLDQILHVTGPGAGEDDLVTQLWEGDLPHLAVVAVPFEGEVEGGGDESAPVAAPMPWPSGAGGEGAKEPGAAPAAQTEGAEATRSDDWDVLARFADLDPVYDELESGAIHEMARLQQALEAETSAPAIPRALELVSDCLATDLTAGDREELERFLPRLLREAIGSGDWTSALTIVSQVRACNPSWPAERFFEGLTAPGSAALTRRAIATLDSRSEDLPLFLQFASTAGEPCAEWLMQVLALSEQQRLRRPLTRVIAELVRAHPESLLPWLADERWYVVRNVVHIFGWIGGDAVAAHLQTAIHHPEIRVRREIVAALAGADPAAARPILMGMLVNAEPRLFTTILHQLSLARDPLLAQRLIEMLRDDRFHDRSEEERRAVYVALASQGDTVLDSLEAELQRGGLFTRGLDPHWQSVALCIARIGTPEARATLERVAGSAKPGARKACEQALASMQAHHE